MEQSKEGIVNFFNNLPKQIVYKLTKIKNTRPAATARIQSGQYVTGFLKLVEVQGEPAVSVSDGYSTIRTSPIVAIIEQQGINITFQTEGGTYQLEILKDNS